MKKTFLTSIVLLATTLAVDANAALPESLSSKLPEMSATQQDFQTQTPFVLERSNDHGVIVAYHSSHASHASHASSRY